KPHTASCWRCGISSKERTMLKSSADHYGAIAITIHWLSPILILVALVAGLRAGNPIDAASKVAFLRVHIPVAIILLLVTLFGIVWWWLFDRKPTPWQVRRYGRSGWHAPFMWRSMSSSLA